MRWIDNRYRSAQRSLRSAKRAVTRAESNLSAAIDCGTSVEAQKELKDIVNQCSSLALSASTAVAIIEKQHLATKLCLSTQTPTLNIHPLFFHNSKSSGIENKKQDQEYGKITTSLIFGMHLYKDKIKILKPTLIMEMNGIEYTEMVLDPKYNHLVSQGLWNKDYYNRSDRTPDAISKSWRVSHRISMIKVIVYLYSMTTDQSQDVVCTGLILLDDRISRIIQKQNGHFLIERPLEPAEDKEHRQITTSQLLSVENFGQDKMSRCYMDSTPEHISNGTKILYKMVLRAAVRADRLIVSNEYLPIQEDEMDFPAWLWIPDEVGIRRMLNYII